MVPLRVLALLPTLTPPAYLTGMAALGHEVHLITTVPNETPRQYVGGVGVWSSGYWWHAAQGTRPHVALCHTGDRKATDLIRRTKLPHLAMPAGSVEDPADLAAALLAVIPAGRLRDVAEAAPADITAPSTTTPVQVVAWVHYGIPYRRAGSEVMLHAMLRALQQSGLSVLAVTSEMPDTPARWSVDQVEYRQMPHAAADMFIRRVQPRVLVTHHHLAPGAIRLAKDIGARSALVVHNDHAGQARFLSSEPDLIAYNTAWVRESLRPDWLEVDRIPGLVVHPPVDPAEHHVDKPGDHVTLVNLSMNKGVGTFRAVAELLPHVPFLGVTGAHGVQETRGMPPNVTVVPHTSNMRDDVWAKTRVLLMPSVYESYGMAAVEAFGSGIPVIAHPTPGLREALGDAATFIDRDDHQGWADAVRALYRGGRRRGAAQRAARERSAYVADQARDELKRWVEAVRQLAGG